MTLNLLVGSLALVSYICGAILLAKQIVKRHTQYHHPIKFGWLVLLMHATYMGLNIVNHQNFDFSFFNAGALVGLCIVALLLIASIDKPVEKLGIAVYPLAALLLGLDLIFPEQTRLLSNYNWQMSVHVLSSIIAFSLLNIAALQAILLAIQDQQLRNHSPQRLILALPPLQAMETLLFQMIATGLAFLTVALISGFVFIVDLFAQHLVHKTVLSIIAWIIFSGLLVGRVRYGWRGSIAIQWTLIGFVLLLMAYFGSKLVLELILKKT